jgi:hypothetical protein
MLLLASPAGGAFAQEAFYGPSGAPFPANYRFSVKISDIRSHGCAGTQYQLSKDAKARHYGVAICTDDSWNVGVYNAAGQPIGQPLAHGHYEQAGTTTLTVTYNRGEQTIEINGIQVAHFPDSQAQTSDIIGLGVFRAACSPLAVPRRCSASFNSRPCLKRSPCPSMRVLLLLPSST